MPTPFGISAGDFIAGIELVHNIIKSLEESTGAAVQYQGVTTAFRSLKSVLVQLKSASDVAQDDPDLVEATENCEETICRFLTKTQKYEKKLGCKTTSSKPARCDWKATLRKIQWQLYTKNDVQEFQSEIQTHVSVLLIILNKFSSDATKQAREENKAAFRRMEKRLDEQRNQFREQVSLAGGFGTWMQSLRSVMHRILDLSKTLHTTLGQIQQCISQIPKSVHSSALTVFEDAHGNICSIDPTFIQTWSAFEMILRENFVNRPGLRRVENGMFRLHDHIDSIEIDRTKCRFNMAFRPGRHILMSVLFEFDEIATDYCPNCGSMNTVSLAYGEACSDCNLWYKRVPGEDVSIVIKNPSNLRGQSGPLLEPGALSHPMHRSDHQGFSQDHPRDFVRISITEPPTLDSDSDYNSGDEEDMQDLEDLESKVADLENTRRSDLVNEARRLRARADLLRKQLNLDLGHSPEDSAHFEASYMPIRTKPLALNDGKEENPSPFVPPGSTRTRPAKLVSCNNIWNQLQSNPDFQNGKFDLDGLCAELKSKARCSELGVVVDQEHIDAALRKLGSENYKNKAYNLTFEQESWDNVANKLKINRA